MIKENKAKDSASVARVAKQQRSRETQEEILTAAFAEFGERGYEGASMNLIAKRAGVGQSLVIYHYPTKEALWVTTVEWALDSFLGRLQPNLEALEGLDPATRLSLIFQDFVRFSSRVPELLELMIDANKRRGSDLARVVEGKLRPAYETLRGLIEDAQKAGAMPAGDPGLIYYSMIAVAATPFSLNRELELLTGRDPLEPEMVEAQANLLARLFFPGLGQAVDPAVQ